MTFKLISLTVLCFNYFFIIFQNIELQSFGILIEVEP